MTVDRATPCVDIGVDSGPRHAPPWQAVMLLGLIGALPTHVSAAPDDDRKPVAEILPIDEAIDRQPDSLQAWHLYRHDGDSPVVGDRVACVGQFDAGSSSVILRQPPWLIVSPEPGAARNRTRQVFSLGLDAAPNGLDADGFGRFEGVLVAARPDIKRDAPCYRLDAARVEPIRLARPVAALAGDVAGIVRREEDRLRAICAEHGLRYDFAADPVGMSWCDGRIAFTARLSAHPGFSFTPVPYAMVSVLFDPATGAADRLVVTRRLWADPPD